MACRVALAAEWDPEEMQLHILVEGFFVASGPHFPMSEGTKKKQRQKPLLLGAPGAEEEVAAAAFRSGPRTSLQQLIKIPGQLLKSGHLLG